MTSSRTALYIILALLLFAIGFIGFNIYRQQQVEEIQNQPAPSIPAVVK